MDKKIEWNYGTYVKEYKKIRGQILLFNDAMDKKVFRKILKQRDKARNNEDVDKFAKIINQSKAEEIANQGRSASREKNIDKALGNRYYKDSLEQIESIKKEERHTHKKSKKREGFLVDPLPEKPLPQQEWKKNPKNEQLKLLKIAAIVSIKSANLYNSIKSEDKKMQAKEYMNKQKGIEDFLYYAQMYNNMVDEENRICFGFYKDEQRNSMVLNTSVPGYSRASFHFGNNGIFTQIFYNANKRLSVYGKENTYESILGLEPNTNRRYVRKIKGKKVEKIYEGYYDLSKIVENKPYILDRYINNNGLINRINYHNIRRDSQNLYDGITRNRESRLYKTDE